MNQALSDVAALAQIQAAKVSQVEVVPFRDDYVSRPTPLMNWLVCDRRAIKPGRGVSESIYVDWDASSRAGNGSTTFNVLI